MPADVANGDGETNPKAPLANIDDEEDIGDPVPANVQAVLSLTGFVAAVMLAMGLTSSEWVIAVDGFYWQGIFVYCASEGFNETLIPHEDDFVAGCRRIDLENQGYTMVVALLASVSLSTNIFGLMLAFLGSWVRDIESKRKVYKLSLYLLITAVVSNLLSLLVYGGCFGEVIETDPLGPFTEPEDDWELGWSMEINLTSAVFQIITTLAVAYSLLLLPIIEEVEVDVEE